jgi:hypothetical protein
MNAEINGETYYPMENFFNPKWWDKWLRNNLKKKARLFPRRVK